MCTVSYMHVGYVCLRGAPLTVNTQTDIINMSQTPSLHVQ